MERGLYIAAAGMLSEMTRQSQIANDLANASTPGYKPDRARQSSFGQLLLSNSRTGQIVGPLGFGSRVDRIVTDFSPGPIRETGEALDFAIAGEGFFAVQTPGGLRFTRNGQFTVGPDGFLSTALGGQVLGPGGAPIAVGRDGRVNARALGVFLVPNARKVGDNMFVGTATGVGGGQVRQGALEGSAADPTRSMVDMIASFRAFEAGQRVITTIDETLEKAANQVGALGS
jgi:flagellar basal-body rod protein FlgF